MLIDVLGGGGLHCLGWSSLSLTIAWIEPIAPYAVVPFWICMARKT